MENRILFVTQKIRVKNIIDEGVDYGSIVYIEFDPECGFNWVYIKAEDNSMNIHSDPKFADKYWNILPSISEQLLYDIE